MNTDRTVLTDDMWERIELLLSGKATDSGRTADNRLFLEAVLWRFRTGSPWRDLPARFGNWNSVFQRFLRWVQKGLFDRIFNSVIGRIRSISRVGGWHDHAGACEGLRVGKRGSCEGIGRSKGGLTSKIVALTDAIGKLVRFVVLPGQSHDLIAMPMLLDPVDFKTLIGDKAFDSDALLDTLADRGVEAVIPPKTNRTHQRDFDRDLYRERHRIENFFARIKEFRAIATRYDKTASSFAAGIHLVAGVIAAR